MSPHPTAMPSSRRSAPRLFLAQSLPWRGRTAPGPPRRGAGGGSHGPRPRVGEGRGVIARETEAALAVVDDPRAADGPQLVALERLQVPAPTTQAGSGTGG